MQAQGRPNPEEVEQSLTGRSRKLWRCNSQKGAIKSGVDYPAFTPQRKNCVLCRPKDDQIRRRLSRVLQAGAESCGDVIHKKVRSNLEATIQLARRSVKTASYAGPRTTKSGGG